MTPDELAKSIQDTVADLELDYPSNQNLKRLHRLLNSAARRSATGQNITRAGIANMGISSSPVPDDTGPGGPGSDK